MDFGMYYALLCGDGYGNSIWSDNRLEHLKGIKKLLIAKYGEQNYRVKYLTLCIIKEESGEFDIEEREWVRYILHPEAEPEDSHAVLLAELEEKMSCSSNDSNKT
jgi:hypothetical protein